MNKETKYELKWLILERSSDGLLKHPQTLGYRGSECVFDEDGYDTIEDAMAEVHRLANNEYNPIHPSGLLIVQSVSIIW